MFYCLILYIPQSVAEMGSDAVEVKESVSTLQTAVRELQVGVLFLSASFLCDIFTQVFIVCKQISDSCSNTALYSLPAPTLISPPLILLEYWRLHD